MMKGTDDSKTTFEDGATWRDNKDKGTWRKCGWGMLNSGARISDRCMFADHLDDNQWFVNALRTFCCKIAEILTSVQEGKCRS